VLAERAGFENPLRTASEPARLLGVQEERVRAVSRRAQAPGEGRGSSGQAAPRGVDLRKRGRCAGPRVVVQEGIAGNEHDLGDESRRDVIGLERRVRAAVRDHGPARLDERSRRETPVEREKRAHAGRLELVPQRDAGGVVPDPADHGGGGAPVRRSEGRVGRRAARADLNGRVDDATELRLGGDHIEHQLPDGDELVAHAVERTLRGVGAGGAVTTIDAVRIGVLAVQGNFREHAAMLRRLGADAVEVRKPEQLEGLDGLVVPGGESTTFMRLMRLYGLDDALRSFAAPVFGTCAGMIVLDRAHLGLVDLEVDRNAYGRQVASFEADLDLAGEREPLRGIFIRAPRVRDVGPDVEVLAELEGEPVLLRDGRFVVASFHPELTEDTRVHELFLDAVREAMSVRA
jgi:5'-phosphate synthase pdxT subunit